MPVTLWMREKYGDYNYSKEFDDREEAVTEMYKIKDRGGYWVENHTVFVPWHQIELVTFDGDIETEGQNG